LPGGGTQTDGFFEAQVRIKPDWAASWSTQFERYNIPLLGGTRSDVTASVEVTYTPRWRLFHN
jgi:hypothetical protein